MNREVWLVLVLIKFRFLMILVWNARGAAGKDFWHAVKELKTRHRVKNCRSCGN